MNELALFAGAGGGILGGKLLGWRTVCAVELEPYARNILLARQRDGVLDPFPIWDDVCTFDGRPWRGHIDVVSGGFPCQAFSTAASGNNIPDKNLWPEMRRIITDVHPNYVFAENVSKFAIESAAEDLHHLGYKCKAVAISAKDLGADHIRERFWLRAHSNNKSEYVFPKYAEAQKLPELHKNIWETDPFSLGVSNGVADWMDRITAIGNGQIPIMATVAWRILDCAGD